MTKPHPITGWVIVDPDGVVRYTEEHTRTLPDPDAALSKLQELQGGA